MIRGFFLSLLVFLLLKRKNLRMRTQGMSSGEAVGDLNPALLMD
jgi:hypothetical protein